MPHTLPSAKAVSDSELPKPLQWSEQDVIRPRARRVHLEHSNIWLQKALEDFKACPGLSLAYGMVFAVIGWGLTFGLQLMGLSSLILPLAGGFMFMAPFMAGGLYDVAKRREAGEEPGFKQALAAVGRNKEIAHMGLALMLLFLAWFQIAMILFALFFGTHPPDLGQFLTTLGKAPQTVPFLMIGTAAGAVLAAIAFAISVVSMPLLLDQPVSALTAIRTSVQVTWVNRLNLIGWAAALVVLGAAGVVAFFIGLAITLPVAAYASWHAYRDLVEV